VHPTNSVRSKNLKIESEKRSRLKTGSESEEKNRIVNWRERVLGAVGLPKNEIMNISSKLKCTKCTLKYVKYREEAGVNEWRKREREKKKKNWVKKKRKFKMS
jgi:hypothetical protein